MAGDVRLTMGGEPTFVAVNDRDAAEWNTDALGPTKRGFATALVHKLRDEYGQGGFLHFGQGKWYPGEQLPRWALNIYWRADKQPVWATPALFTDERAPTHYTSADASNASPHCLAKLGLTDQVHPEPPMKTAGTTCGASAACRSMWTRSTPNSTTRWNARACAGCSSKSSIRWWAMCCRSRPPDMLARPDRPGWTTGPWFFRDERMYLMPGDSPMGLRLPLDSLPWVSESDYPYMMERDPTAARGDLPAHASDGRALQRSRDMVAGTHCHNRTGAAAGKRRATPARIVPAACPLWQAAVPLRLPRRLASSSRAAATP
jgi:uncharacterized protein (DUF2126 family)